MAFPQLSTIRADIRSRADIRDDGKHTTDADVDRYLNRQIAKLYSKLSKTNPSLFTKKAGKLTSIGANKLQLPSDFYKLVEVSVQTRGTGRFIRANQADIQDHAVLEDQVNRGDMYTQYSLEVNNEAGGRFELSVYPEPVVTSGKADYVFVRYVPKPPVLSVDTETLNWPDLWVEWVTLGAAITCLNREESDPSMLKMEHMEVDEMVMSDIQDYTPATPETIRRTAKHTHRNRYRFRGI